MQKLITTLDSVRDHVLNPVSQDKWSANNKQRWLNCTNEGYGGDSFYGASWDSAKRQLTNGVDDFEKWLASAKMSRPPKVESRRRRRFYNDTYGEVEYDRKWDVRPFEAIRKDRLQTHNVQVKVMADFNGMVRAESIREYGIKVFELVNALETTGRSVELTLYYYDSGVYTNQRDQIWTEVLIKKSGEYVSPQIIATCLTPFFFRRFMFQEWVIFGAQNGWEMSSGFGSALSFKHKELTIEDNVIYIENNNPTTFNLAHFNENINKILEALL